MEDTAKTTKFSLLNRLVFHRKWLTNNHQKELSLPSQPKLNTLFHRINLYEFIHLIYPSSVTRLHWGNTNFLFVANRFNFPSIKATNFCPLLFRPPRFDEVVLFRRTLTLSTPPKNGESGQVYQRTDIGFLLSPPTTQLLSGFFSEPKWISLIALVLVKRLSNLEFFTWLTAIETGPRRKLNESYSHRSAPVRLAPFYALRCASGLGSEFSLIEAELRDRDFLPAQ